MQLFIELATIMFYAQWKNASNSVDTVVIQNIAWLSFIKKIIIRYSNRGRVKRKANETKIGTNWLINNSRNAFPGKVIRLSQRQNTDLYCWHYKSCFVIRYTRRYFFSPMNKSFLMFWCCKEHIELNRRNALHKIRFLNYNFRTLNRRFITKGNFIKFAFKS